MRSLGAALSTFWRYPSPRIIAAGLATALTLRVGLALGGVLPGPRGWDALVVGAIMLVLWPLQEWWMHQHILHMRPREILGRTFDPEFARGHRGHHREPWDISKMLLERRLVLSLWLPVFGLAWLLTPSLELGLSAAAGYFAAGLLYEWVHYLSHTSVRPRSGWFRRVRRNHRYHHYKSEHYWHGFTVPLFDTLLGTNPRPRDIETSKTARTLGVDDPEDDRAAGAPE